MSNFDLRIKVNQTKSHNRTNSKQQPQPLLNSGMNIYGKQQQPQHKFPVIKQSQNSYISKSPISTFQSPYQTKEQPFNLSMGSSLSKKLNHGKLLHNTDKDNDLIVLKEQNMKLILEKNTLKSENMRLEKELIQKEKLIQEVVNQNQNALVFPNNEEYNKTMNKTKETFLVDRIKRQYKELQQFSKQKEEELDKLKKNTKITKQNELNEEIRILSLELNKLRTLYNNVIESKDNLTKQVIEQAEMIKKVKYKNIIEEENGKKLLYELQLREEKLRDVEDKFNSYIDSTYKLSIDNKNNINTNNDNNNVNINQLIKERDHFKGLNEEKEKRIKDVEKDYSEVCKKINAIYNNNESTIDNQFKKNQDDLHITQEHSHELKKRPVQFKYANQENIELLNAYSRREINDLIKKSNKIGNIIIDKSKYTEKLSDEKVEEIGYLLQKMFEALNYTKQEVEDVLFKDIEIANDNFIEKLSQKIVEVLLITNQNEVDLIINFIGTCIDNYSLSLDYDYFKLKFMLLFDSIVNYGNTDSIKDSIKHKLQTLKNVFEELDKDNTQAISITKFKEIMEPNENTENELKVDELEYLFFEMKKIPIDNENFITKADKTLELKNVNTDNNSVYGVYLNFIYKLILERYQADNDNQENNHFNNNASLNLNAIINNENKEIKIHTSRENPKNRMLRKFYYSFHEFLDYYEYPLSNDSHNTSHFKGFDYNLEKVNPNISEGDLFNQSLLLSINFIKGIKEHLTESMLSFEEFMYKEILGLKSTEKNTELKVFHINSLIKLIFKYKICHMIQKEDVDILMRNFRLCLLKKEKDSNSKKKDTSIKFSSSGHIHKINIHSTSNHLNGVSSTNQQICNYFNNELLESKVSISDGLLNYNLFESFLKLPKLSFSEKRFYLNFKEYLQSNDIPVSSIPFFLQRELKIFNCNNISELIDDNIDNKFLIDLMMNNYSNSNNNNFYINNEESYQCLLVVEKEAFIEFINKKKIIVSDQYIPECLILHKYIYECPKNSDRNNSNNEAIKTITYINISLLIAKLNHMSLNFFASNTSNIVIHKNPSTQDIMIINNNVLLNKASFTSNICYDIQISFALISHSNHKIDIDCNYGNEEKEYSAIENNIQTNRSNQENNSHILRENPRNSSPTYPNFNNEIFHEANEMNLQHNEFYSKVKSANNVNDYAKRQSKDIEEKSINSSKFNKQMTIMDLNSYNNNYSSFKNPNNNNNNYSDNVEYVEVEENYHSRKGNKNFEKETMAIQEALSEDVEVISHNIGTSTKDLINMGDKSLRRQMTGKDSINTAIARKKEYEFKQRSKSKNFVDDLLNTNFDNHKKEKQIYKDEELSHINHNNKINISNTSLPGANIRLSNNLLVNNSNINNYLPDEDNQQDPNNGNKINNSQSLILDDEVDFNNSTFGNNRENRGKIDVDEVISNNEHDNNNNWANDIVLTEEAKEVENANQEESFTKHANEKHSLNTINMTEDEINLKDDNHNDTNFNNAFIQESIVNKEEDDIEIMRPNNDEYNTIIKDASNNNTITNDNKDPNNYNNGDYNKTQSTLEDIKERMKQKDSAKNNGDLVYNNIEKERLRSTSIEFTSGILSGLSKGKNKDYTHGFDTENKAMNKVVNNQVEKFSSINNPKFEVKKTVNTINTIKTNNSKESGKIGRESKENIINHDHFQHDKESARSKQSQTSSVYRGRASNFTENVFNSVFDNKKKYL